MTPCHGTRQFSWLVYPSSGEALWSSHVPHGMGHEESTRKALAHEDDVSEQLALEPLLDETTVFSKYEVE